MTSEVKYLLNKATEAEITEHLLCCDEAFLPPLSVRVQINEYARKITNRATRFEAWSGNILVGLVAAYCNDWKKHTVYITNVSVLANWKGKGIAYWLIRHCIEHARALSMRKISLEVANINISAIELYKKLGFVGRGTNEPFHRMDLSLKGDESIRNRQNH